MLPDIALRVIEPQRTHETETKLSPPFAEDDNGAIVGPVRVSWARWPRSSNAFMDRSPCLLVQVTRRAHRSGGNGHHQMWHVLD